MIINHVSDHDIGGQNVIRFVIRFDYSLYLFRKGEKKCSKFYLGGYRANSKYTCISETTYFALGQNKVRIILIYDHEIMSWEVVMSYEAMIMSRRGP
jgi:hypothetical protein